MNTPPNEEIIRALTLVRKRIASGSTEFGE